MILALVMFMDSVTRKISMSEKQHRVEAKEYVSFNYVKLDELIVMAKKLRAEYGADARIEFREEYGAYQAYVVWERPESGLEKKRRLEKEEDNQDLRRRQYARLKKEFGDA